MALTDKKYDELVKLFKKEPELGQRAAADRLDVPVSDVGMLQFCNAQVDAGIWSEIGETAKAVKDARDKDGNRWEMIMARSGLSRAKVIELYGGEEEAKASYTGRGRNFAENGKTEAPTTRVSRGRAAKTETAKTGSAKKSTAKKSAAKKSTAATGRKAAAAKKTIQRNTRGRRSSASNPS